jgi:hypothetical protein
MPAWYNDEDMGRPFDRFLLLKSLEIPLAPRPGAGHAARPPPPAPRKPAKAAVHIFHHGDQVTFRHGLVEGRGKLVASSMAAVIVRTSDGVEHRVAHGALIPP